MKVQEFIEFAGSQDLMMVIPQGNDGSISHAINITDGMIFDSTQKFPLIMSKLSFDFVCGECGCYQIYMTKVSLLKMIFNQNYNQFETISNTIFFLS